MLVTKTMKQFLRVNQFAEDRWRDIEWYLAYDADSFNYVTNKMLAIDQKNTKVFYSPMIERYPEWYECLMFLHHKKHLFMAFKKATNSHGVRVVVEFMGTPRSGKTSCINMISDFLKCAGLKVEVIPDIVKLNNGFNLFRDNLTVGSFNKMILKQSYEQLFEHFDADIVLVDSGMNDRLVWNYICYQRQGFSEEEYDELTRQYQEYSRNINNALFILKASSEESIRRNRISSLCLEQEAFASIDDTYAYNKALSECMNVLKCSIALRNEVHFFELDTDEFTFMHAYLIMANRVLDALLI